MYAITANDRWALWANDITEDWPDSPSDARPDLAELAETVRRGTERAARWSSDNVAAEEPLPGDRPLRSV